MSEAVCLIFRFWHLADIVRAGDSQHLIEENDLPALLSLLDVPTDDLQWLRLDPPRATPVHAGLYSALKKTISAY